MIGERISQARQSAGLPLRNLAKQVGVSAMAISKYERGEITPSSEVLIALGKALGVRVEYFFRQAQVELKEVEYRKHSSLPERDKQRILAEVRDQLERWLALEVGQRYHHSEHRGLFGSTPSVTWATKSQSTPPHLLQPGPEAALRLLINFMPLGLRTIQGDGLTIFYIR